MQPDPTGGLGLMVAHMPPDGSLAEWWISLPADMDWDGATAFETITFGESTVCLTTDTGTSYYLEDEFGLAVANGGAEAHVILEFQGDTPGRSYQVRTPKAEPVNTFGV